MLLGRQEPHILCVPEYVASLGHEAIGLYERHSRKRLDVWQKRWTIDTLGVRRDGSWATFESALMVQRQNGKGEPFMAIELAGLYLFGEETIIHSAHQLKTAKEAFRRTVEVIDGSDELSAKVKRILYGKGEEGIELISGARLLFLARSGASGRGFSGQRVHLDESLDLDGEEMAAVVPTMAAQEYGQLVYASTPPKLSTAHIVSLRRRAMAGDPRLVYHGWENPRGADLEDRRTYAEVNPAYGRRITDERLADIRKAMNDDDLFARECAGIWPATADELWQVIGEEDWGDREDPESRAEGQVVAGIDMTDDRAWTSIGIAGRRADGDEHGQLAEHGPGSTWPVLWVVDAAMKRRISTVVVGRNGPARSIIPQLQAEAKRLLDEHRIVLNVLTPGTADVCGGCGDFYDAVAGANPEDRRLWHTGQYPLTTAVAGAAKRKVGLSWMWEPVVEGVVMSPLFSVTLARMGLLSVVETPAPAYSRGAEPPKEGTDFWRPTSRLDLGGKRL